MNLFLIRSDRTKACTLGDLLLGKDMNGKWLCYTLEDPWHEEKVYGDTCIPEGTYEVVLDYSPHFKRTLPHLLGVRNFVGILMHGGNTKIDTFGCVLCGMERRIDGLGNCAPAVQKVIDLLSAPGPHYITIKKAENV